MDNIKRSVTYGYYPLLRDDQGYYQDISLYGPTGIDCTYLYNEYIGGSKLSEKQKLELFHNLICDVFVNPNKREMSDIVYYKLLNKGKKYTNTELIFIAQYTVYKSYINIRYDINGREKPGYEYFKMPFLGIRYDLPKSETFSGVHREPGIIELNYDQFASQYISRPFNTNITQSEIIDFLHVICHEMTHHRQQYEAQNNLLTKSAYDYICRRVFYQHKFDTPSNYGFRQIEVEAELDGMMQAIRLGRDYTPGEQRELESAIRRREQIILEKAASVQYANGFNKYYLTDEYDVRGMVEAVRKDPNIFKYFPQLRQLYDERTGNMVSEERLLDLYDSARGGAVHADQIYEQYLIYKYSDRNILLNNNLSNNLLHVKINFIKMELRKEYEYCRQIYSLSFKPNLLRMSKKFFDDNAGNIIRLRRDRISAYQDFLKRVHVDKSFIQLSDEMIRIYDDTETRLKGDLARRRAQMNVDIPLNTGYDSEVSRGGMRNGR